MSRTAKLGAISYEAETPTTGWAEDVATFTTTRLPILGLVDASGLEQSRIDSNRTVQLRNERALPYLGPKGGAFKTTLYLTGHGSTTAGATALTAVETLLGIVFGNAAVAAAAGTTLNGAQTDADTWTTTASGTFTPGSVGFLGAGGDAAGNGQAFEVETHTGTALQASTAVDATPAAGAVVYSAANIYSAESPTASDVASVRMLLVTASQSYEVHGCFPMSVEWDTPNGRAWSVTITWGCSWWRESATTLPLATSQNDFVPGASAAGSFYYQVFGTRTRQKIAIASLKITHKLGVTPKEGTGGVNAYQTIIGATREPDEMMIEWTEDAPATSAAPTRPADFDTEGYRHLLISASQLASGKRVALRFKKFAYSGRRPVQFNDNGINRYRCQGWACADPAGTNDITRAAYILAMG